MDLLLLDEVMFNSVTKCLQGCAVRPPFDLLAWRAIVYQYRGGDNCCQHFCADDFMAALREMLMT
jgi:hypothetical protein